MTLDQAAVSQQLAAQLGREPTQAEINAVMAFVSAMPEPARQEPAVALPADGSGPVAEGAGAPAAAGPPRPEGPQAEPAKLDTVRADAIRAEEAKLKESARVEASLADEAKQKAAQVEVAGTGRPEVAAGQSAMGFSGGPSTETLSGTAATGSVQDPGPASDYSISASFEWRGAEAGSRWETLNAAPAAGEPSIPAPVIDKEKVEIWENMSHGMHQLGETAEESLEDLHEKKIGDGTAAHICSPAAGEWQASVGVPMDQEKDLGRVELGADAAMLGAAVAAATAGLAASKAWDKLSSTFGDGPVEVSADAQPGIGARTLEPALDKALEDPAPKLADAGDAAAGQNAEPDVPRTPEPEVDKALPDPAVNDVGADAAAPVMDKNEMAAYALNHLRDPVTYPSLGPEMDEQLAPFESALQAVDDRIAREMAADPSFAEVSDLYRDSEYQQIYDEVIDMYGADYDPGLETSTSFEPAVLDASDASDVWDSVDANMLFEVAGTEVTGPAIGGPSAGIGGAGL